MKTKKILVTIALVMGTISFSGCTGGGTTSTTQPTAPAQTPQTIAESSVAESSTVKKEYVEFSESVAEEWLKKAFALHDSEAIIGKMKMIYSYDPDFSSEPSDKHFIHVEKYGKCYEFYITGHRSVKDTYGYEKTKDFRYDAMVYENGKITSGYYLAWQDIEVQELPLEFQGNYKDVE